MQLKKDAQKIWKESVDSWLNEPEDEPRSNNESYPPRKRDAAACKT